MFWNDAVEKTRKKIFRRTKPKTFCETNLDGPRLLQLAYAYTDTINSGKMPNIENAWQYIVKNESLKAKNEALNEMQKLLKEADRGQVLDEDWLANAKKQAMKVFKINLMGNNEDNEQVKNKLKDEIDLLILEKQKVIKRDLQDLVRKWFDDKSLQLSD